MKRTLFIILLFLSVFVCGVSSAWAESYVPSRTINLVYDDSGSMIRMGDTYVDTWCQAKYAMEVVASMLDERDTLNIYYMSDYVKDTKSRARLSLHGSKNASVVKANVGLIHDLVTKASDTPFNAVRRAHEDLKKVSTDERWLVVLTDGEFEDGAMKSAEVEAYYRDVVSDGQTRVMMLAMGPSAAMIEGDASKGIYFEHASSTAAILPKLTTICNRIFQRNALPMSRVEKSNGEISFGVPMRELIVFAQGREVQIAGAVGSDGQRVVPSSNVHATYSTQASTTNPEGTIVNENLNGYVATFDREFEPGTWKLDIQNADNIDVYYKPNVAIRSYLYNAIGDEVTAQDNLVNGTYRLEFGFVNATTGAKVEDASLLGKVVFTSDVTNKGRDGKETVVKAVHGDKIEIREGELKVEVTAKFLEYNTVTTTNAYQVYFRNELVFEWISKPTWGLTSGGISNATEAAIVRVAMKDGDKMMPLNAEQWNAMEVPRLRLLMPSDSEAGKLNPEAPADLGLTIQKGQKIGEFEILPSLSGKDPFMVVAGTMPLVIAGEFSTGMSTAAGNLSDNIVLSDDITSMERLMRWLEAHWGKVLSGILGFIYLLGLMVKRRFPKRLKSQPLIKQYDNRRREMSTTNAVRRNDTFLNLFCPFRAETCKYCFDNLNDIRLEAWKKQSIYLCNPKDFENTEVRFEGEKVEELRSRKSDGKRIIQAGSVLTWKDYENYSYKCSLTVDTEES